MSLPGRLIIVEGPDGVGKSTLTALLVGRLRESGYPCQTYAFPGNEPKSLGALVYRLHHDPTALGVDSIRPAALQAMHVAAHLDAIERVFRPRLLAGEQIIVDRYWWSTWVYGVVGGVSPEVLETLIEGERRAWGIHVPLVAFLIDRPTPWRANEDSPAWQRLAVMYRELALREQSAHAVRLLPNTARPEDTATEMATIVWELLGGSRSQPADAAQARPQGQLRLDFASTADAPIRHSAPLVISRIGGVKPTPVFDTYWRFAVERQEIYFRRFQGAPSPWSADPILRHHRFTNAYRASDRVSQYLIRDVIYRGHQGAEELFFRIILFRLFNRIETWNLLTTALGTPTAAEFRPDRYEEVLLRAMRNGQRIYSAAYIMPAAPGSSGQPKHAGHLRLLERMLHDELPRRLSDTRSLRHAFELLRGYPMMGDFLALQYVIDLNYSSLLNFSEMEFVVPGPGARSGISKCFSSLGGLSESDLIRLVTENQREEFDRRGLTFRDLWGRALQLIDCQNLFCEVDKYARIAHPEASGEGGRTRIKQVLRPDGRPPAPWYPPKWGLNERIGSQQEAAGAPDRS